ncbi:MAG: hypothetical protein GX616_13400 [Planctomycetes bacterium]|nr:hypothetical protein [Planctomycetota bacterium]
MAKFSLRRYEEQARVSFVAALASVVTFVGLLALVLRRFSLQEMAIFYGQRTYLAVLVATAVTALLAVIGFGLGISSVGQRRNEKQGLSWAGFFVAAAVLVLTICVFAFFFLRGESVGR